MAYADVGDVSNGDTIATTWGDQVRANFIAGVPDIFTTEGDIAIATAADTATRLAVGTADSFLVSGAARPEWQIAPACRVYDTTDHDPATTTWESVTFDSERFDSDALHNPASNPSRLTIPANGDGLYTIGACMEFDTGDSANDNSIVGVRLLLNGATVIAQQLVNIYRAEAEEICIVVETVYDLDATDYVEAQVYTDRDVNVNAVGNYSPEFWAVWQRRP